MNFIKCKTANSRDVERLLFDVKPKYKIGEYLQKKVEWDLVFSMMNSMVDDMNSNTFRFVKSEIISKTIEYHSKNNLLFVNKNGYDFEFSELLTDDPIPRRLRLELKSHKDIFGKGKKGKTKSFSLDNTNGQSSLDKTYVKTFDYLLIMDLKRAAIIKYEDIQEENLKYLPDGRKIQLNYFQLDFIVDCHDIRKKNMKLRNRYDQMIMQFILDGEKAYYESI